jgi:uncharacterized protein
VRNHSTFVFDVRELLEASGTRRSVAVDAPVAGLDAGIVTVPGEVRLEAVLEAIDGGVLARGTMKGEYRSECRRCLREVRAPFRFTGDEVYRPKGDVWEEGYEIVESKVDLELMVRDTVALNLPPNPLCREDCAGLCPRCGADLNEGACGCPEETDPRWSALRDLGRLNG